jgi:hypothetical protein
MPRPVALDLAFQALADPSRRIMVERLARGEGRLSRLGDFLDETDRGAGPRRTE